LPGCEHLPGIGARFQTECPFPSEQTLTRARMPDKNRRAVHLRKLKP
jgi:hypothetical protein